MPRAVRFATTRPKLSRVHPKLHVIHGAASIHAQRANALNTISTLKGNRLFPSSLSAFVEEASPIRMQWPTALHLARQSKRPPRQAASDTPKRRHEIVKLTRHENHPCKVFAAPISHSFGHPLDLPNRGPQDTPNGRSKWSPLGASQRCLLELPTTKPQKPPEAPDRSSAGSWGRPSELPSPLFFAGGGHVFLWRWPYFFSPKI